MTTYNFNEGDGNVQVCAQLTTFPTGFPQASFDIAINFAAGAKAGKMIYMYSLYARISMLICSTVHSYLASA